METTKRNKVIYWIFTIWTAFGMLSTGVMQAMHVKAEVDMINHLGYPLYFLTLVSIWKVLGSVAILVPRYPVLKEWAYAGFFFTMTGALVSHVAVGDTLKEMFPPVFLLILVALSYFFRPTSRRPAINVNLSIVS